MRPRDHPRGVQVSSSEEGFFSETINRLGAVKPRVEGKDPTRVFRLVKGLLSLFVGVVSLGNDRDKPFSNPKGPLPNEDDVQTNFRVVDKTFSCCV